MVQGVNKEYIFKSKDYINLYLSIFNNEKLKYNFSILAYCMMNNHAHFLFYVENIDELAVFMHDVNGKFAKKYNEKEERCGVLFRNRYHTEPIYDEKYLINCINYIHMNPVNAGMVDDCSKYRYSSYNDYVSHSGVANCEIMNEIFGKDFDYISIFKSCHSRIFDDVEQVVDNARYYINSGVNYFKRKYNVSLCDIFSDENVLKGFINFLYNECNIHYVHIEKFLGFSKWKLRSFIE